MDSLRSVGLKVAGVSAVGVLGYYCLSRLSGSKCNKAKQAGSKNQNIVLFFDELGTRCYTLPDHDTDNCPLTECPVRHLRTLRRLVSKATSSVDVCLYNLTQPELEECLVALIRNGKKVRCVAGDRQDAEREFVKRLRKEGAFVSVKDPKPPAGYPFQVSDLLMHHKFVIIDNKILITGSMNWTVSSFNCNWDHMIISVDPYLVRQFAEEFEYLHSSNQSDERACSTRPVAGPPLQAVFFRRQGVLCRADANRKKKCEKIDCMFTVYKSIIHRILSASVSLDICAQQITLEDLSNEVCFAHEKGVKVRVICEKFMSRGTGSQIRNFIETGIPVHMQTGEGTLHHKFIIVDGKILFSGSLNWTMQSFFGNYENILLVSDKDVVSRFEKEFQRLWDCFPCVESV